MKFSDLGAVVKYGHFNNLKVGWYQNGCACGEKQELDVNYEGDVRNLHDLNFDAVKLDGCGAQRNLTKYAQLMKQSGKSYAIENCHWGRCTDSDDSSCPTQEWCPFNWCRTSGDINSGSQSWFDNLQTAVRFLQDPPLSQPGCWAYPDMLEVGRVAEPLPNTRFSWNRAHFGAWCVISAPLILGLDLTDRATLESIIPVIGNKEAIAVNQQWAGHPGRFVAELPAGGNSTADEFVWGETCDASGADETQLGWVYNITKGEIRGSNGKCLTYGNTYGNSVLTLEKCEAKPGQSWNYNPAKRAFTDTVDKNCLDLFNGQNCDAAPRANLYPCNGGKNQQWTVHGNGTFVDACGACLGTKTTPPPGGSQPGGDKVQLWAKIQPQGRVAALVINNSPVPTNVDVSFAALNITSASVAVRDIWDLRDLGTANVKYPVSVSAYDSAFLMLTPVS